MKIRILAIVNVVRKILGLVPNAPHVNVRNIEFVAASNRYVALQPGGLVPVRGFAINVDAGILSMLARHQLATVRSVISPTNAVVLIVSDDYADALRRVTGLPT